MSYACERIIIMNMTTMVISVFTKIHMLLLFYLTLTRGPIIVVKKNIRVILR